MINWKATKKIFFEFTDLYAEEWAKREQVNLKYLSQWKDRAKVLVVDLSYFRFERKIEVTQMQISQLT